MLLRIAGILEHILARREEQGYERHEFIDTEESNTSKSADNAILNLFKGPNSPTFFNDSLVDAIHHISSMYNEAG